MTDDQILSELAKLKGNVKPALLQIGSGIRGWRVTAFAGKGASSEVYRAVKNNDGREVVAALKILTHPENKQALTRFNREIEILSLSSHPAIVKYIDSGEHEGHPYLITEYLEPLVLPSSDRGVAKFLIALSHGIAYLHARGFVHRDIKPSNIMARGREPVLIDLGLIKETTGPAVSFAPLTIIDGKPAGAGSPEYAAPEQFSGEEITPQSDVHALGVLANKCFEGKPPRAWEKIILNATSSIKERRYSGINGFIKAIKHRRSFRLHPIVTTLLIIIYAKIFWFFYSPLIGNYLIERAERKARQSLLTVEEKETDDAQPPPKQLPATPPPQPDTVQDFSDKDIETFFKEGVLYKEGKPYFRNHYLYDPLVAQRDIPYPDKDIETDGKTYLQSLNIKEVDTPKLEKEHHRYSNNPDDYITPPDNVIVRPGRPDFPDLFCPSFDRSGEPVVLKWKEPLKLKSGDRIKIPIYGVLIADISGPSDAWVMISDTPNSAGVFDSGGVLINTTTNVYQQNAIRYFLRGDASVNFINLDSVNQINPKSAYNDIHCRYGASQQGLIYCGGGDPKDVIDWYSTEYRTQTAKERVLDMKIYRSEEQFRKVHPEDLIDIETPNLTRLLKSYRYADPYETLQELVEKYRRNYR